MVGGTSGGNWKRPVNRMYTYNYQVRGLERVSKYCSFLGHITINIWPLELRCCINHQLPKLGNDLYICIWGRGGQLYYCTFYSFLVLKATQKNCTKLRFSQQSVYNIQVSNLKPKLIRCQLISHFLLSGRRELLPPHDKLPGS